MTEKPTALRLADDCDEGMVDFAEVAAELRRLHAENERLWAGEAFHKVAVQQRDAAWRERDTAELMSLALKAQRDELLEALLLAWPHIEGEKIKQDGSYGSNFVQAKADRIRAVYEKARAAIAAATGE